VSRCQERSSYKVLLTSELIDVFVIHIQKMLHISIIQEIKFNIFYVTESDWRGPVVPTLNITLEEETAT
jgi:hypothetical protein